MCKGDNMGMTRKQKHLVGLRQLTDSLKRIACTLRIEVDENIVEDDRKRVRVPCIVAQERKSHGEV